jgi:hypothetical protein
MLLMRAKAIVSENSAMSHRIASPRDDALAESPAGQQMRCPRDFSIIQSTDVLGILLGAAGAVQY